MESLVTIGGDGNISETSHRGMLFGTDVEYAIFHQEGTSRMPARPPVGLSETTLQTIVDGVADAAVQSMKYVP
jgi:phage gpG-like protein